MFGPFSTRMDIEKAAAGHPAYNWTIERLTGGLTARAARPFAFAGRDWSLELCRIEGLVYVDLFRELIEGEDCEVAFQAVVATLEDLTGAAGRASDGVANDPGEIGAGLSAVVSLVPAGRVSTASRIDLGGGDPALAALSALIASASYQALFDYDGDLVRATGQDGPGGFLRINASRRDA